MTFKDASREAASVYVVGFTDGIVKVGFSNNPKSRLRRASFQLRSITGAMPDKWHVFGSIGRHISGKSGFEASKAARKFEAECIDLLSSIGTQVFDTREVFSGVDFEKAIEALSDLAMRRKQAA